jgi:hypothetical protein
VRISTAGPGILHLTIFSSISFSIVLTAGDLKKLKQLLCAKLLSSQASSDPPFFQTNPFLFEDRYDFLNASLLLTEGHGRRRLGTKSHNASMATTGTTPSLHLIGLLLAIPANSPHRTREFR